MDNIILQVKQVSKTYRVSPGMFKRKLPLKAVDNVSMSVEKGSVMGLVGESGCGKSTLARLILSLEPPDKGEIYVNGKSFSHVQRKEAARMVQVIFQDPYSSLNPRKSIESIISLPLRVHKIADGPAISQKVSKIMDIVGLSKRMKYNFPNQLSGGQRQRVAVARALIMRPDIVICDEPTSALDVSVQAQIINLLKDLQKEFKLTYLIISHDLAVVEHMADNVCVMYLGKIVEQATTQDIFHSPAHPYTKALLSSILTPDPGMELPSLDLGATYPNPIDPPKGCRFHPRCPDCVPKCSSTAPKPLSKGDHMVECHQVKSL